MTTAALTTPDVDDVARAFLRRFGTHAAFVEWAGCEESGRLIEMIPRVAGSQAIHRMWADALEALEAKHCNGSDDISGAANAETAYSLFEGYVFGLAVGRQLTADDHTRREDHEEAAALRNTYQGDDDPPDGKRPPLPNAPFDSEEATRLHEAGADVGGVR